MQYTAVIRTLGTSGDKYQRLLNSLVNQTLPPYKIIVYIAEGYAIPKETVNVEEYVFVKKGMVAQRALLYSEVETEYMLFLDDDLAFPETTVEDMYNEMVNHDLDVIAPDIYNNSGRSLINEMMMLISGRMCPRYIDDDWGYKVMRNSGYSYKKRICKNVYRSETNAGAAFLCKKADFIKINLQDELWQDRVQYAIGDDQVVFYKMHKFGIKVGTWYNHSFVHLDGGQNTSIEKEKNLIYSDFRFKTIFWHRFIYKPEKNIIIKLHSFLALVYSFAFAFVVSLLKCRLDVVKIKYTAVKDGIRFIHSTEYKDLPLI